jgi:hypothetical protein
VLPHPALARAGVFRALLLHRVLVLKVMFRGSKKRHTALRLPGMRAPQAVKCCRRLAWPQRCRFLSQNGHASLPTQCGITEVASTCAKDRHNPNSSGCMPGAGLSQLMRGKVLSYMPAFQPYRGKPAVRNDGEGRGMSASYEARSAPRLYPTAGGAR